jgi:hypothetical protein
LAPAAETAAERQDAAPYDPKAAAEAIARLRALIEANDAEAVDALAAVQHASGKTVDRARFDALREALDDFDFDVARRRLEEIAGQCVG